MAKDTLKSDNIDFKDYDPKEIYSPGRIQSHGVLIVLEKSSLNIIAMSENAKDFLKINSDEFLNMPINNLIGDRKTNSIKKCLKKDFLSINPLKVNINNQYFNAIIHEIKNEVIVELETIYSKKRTNFFSFYNITREIITNMQNAHDLTEISQIIVKNIRNLTDFDRVMVYRFDEDNSGYVIAEDKQEDLETFYKFHFPANDIIKPAREIFLLNYIRTIPDISAEEITLDNHPINDEPFDLSLSILRGVDPCHIEYLSNMGVKGVMTISLVANDKLWGLIACHHYQEAKYIPYEIRTVCEFLAQVMSLELVAKEEKEDLDYKIQLRGILAKLIEQLSQSDDLIEDLIQNSDDLQKLANSHGLAICDNQNIYLLGKTPSEEEVKDLINWIIPNIENDIYYTDKLPKLYNPSQKFKTVASGVLALCLNQINHNYILWFRPEVIQTVEWAGNPNNPIVTEEDGSMTLCPRTSFEQWKEHISDQSLPWQKCEIQQVMELRILIVEIIFRKSYALAQLNTELQRSNKELDSFAYVASHDLKEPLRGIYNYSQFLLEDYKNILDESGENKLNTLIILSKRMENLIESLLHYSRIGRHELNITNINIEDIIENIKIVLKASSEKPIDIFISKPLPQILGDSLLIEELFTNLITNAYKYNNSKDKWVEIGYLEESENETYEIPSTDTIFYLKDNGIGIRKKHQDIIFRIFKRLHAKNKYGGGTGAGLTIVKKIVERHNGNIWLDSVYGEGTTFYFTLQTQ